MIVNNPSFYITIMSSSIYEMERACELQRTLEEERPDFTTQFLKADASFQISHTRAPITAVFGIIRVHGNKRTFLFDFTPVLGRTILTDKIHLNMNYETLMEVISEADASN